MLVTMTTVVEVIDNSIISINQFADRDFDFDFDGSIKAKQHFIKCCKENDCKYPHLAYNDGNFTNGDYSIKYFTNKHTL